MKNKKIIYLIIVLLVIGIAIVSGILLKNKNIDKGDIPDETEPKNLIEAVMKKNNKTTMDYKKFVGGEVLSTNTLFTKYTFVNDNTVYNIYLTIPYGKALLQYEDFGSFAGTSANPADRRFPEPGLETARRRRRPRG